MHTNAGVFDIRSYGAGGADNTAAIQAAVAAADATGGIVTGDPSATYQVGGRINLNGAILSGLHLSYGDNAAKLVLGGSSQIKNVKLDLNATSASFSSALSGAVNLHLADGVIIDGLEITDGDSNRIGIFCATLASNTTIRNCRMNYVGWPILFNDQVAAARIVDSVDYAGQSIGSNLKVYDCELGASDKTSVGDGIEINAPTERMGDIVIERCRIRKTNTTTGNGIGIGVANCDGVVIRGNVLANVSSNAAGAIHTEKSTAVLIEGNTVRDSDQGIGCGNEGQDTAIIGNLITSCTEGIAVRGTTAEFDNLTLHGNVVVDTANFPFILQNLKAARISENHVQDINGASKNAFTLIQTGAPVFDAVAFSGNTFAKTNGVAYGIASFTGTITGLLSYGNVFSGIGGNDVAAWFAGVRGRGQILDHYKISTDATAGLNGTATRNPQGWLTGGVGDLVLDVNAGIQYRHNGSVWVAEVLADIVSEATAAAGVTIDGVLLKDGLVSGRNVATDAAKLDGIEAGATADQSDAEILTAWQTATGRTVATDAAKLDGIEAAADVTDATNVAAAGAYMADGTVALNGPLDHDGSTAGFYGVTPVARPAAYTQTYATATRTHAARTAAALTNSQADTTTDGTLEAIGNTTSVTVDRAPQIERNFSELNAQLNNLRADQQNTAQLLNQLLDDLQSLGLSQ